jgi:hypothetical protein
VCHSWEADRIPTLFCRHADRMALNMRTGTVLLNGSRSGARPRYRGRSPLDITREEEEEKHRQADYVEDARRRRTAKKSFTKGMFRRLRVIIHEMGGSRAASAVTKVPRSTVAGWVRDLKPELPAPYSLALVAEGSGTSLDWLWGFDVPKLRRERELVVDLERQLRTYIAQSLAEELSTNRVFAEAVLPPAETILSEIVGRYHGEVARTLERKQNWARQRATRITTAVGNALGLVTEEGSQESLATRAVRTAADDIDRDLGSLPPTEPENVSQERR